MKAGNDENIDNEIPTARGSCKLQYLVIEIGRISQKYLSLQNLQCYAFTL